MCVDYVGLRRHLALWPLMGHMVQAGRVVASAWVQVSPVDDNILSFMEMYLENKRIGGGLLKSAVEYHEDIQCAIAEYCDMQGTYSVLLLLLNN